MVDVTPEQLAASLIADVDRIYPWSKDQPMMLEADVLSALARAMGPDDLVEQAGMVLEGVTPGRVVQFHPYYCEEAKGTQIGEWDSSHDLSAIQPDGKRYRLGSMRHADDAVFFQWCREGVPALLARISAQEAQIKGLQKIISESEAHRYRSVGELLTRAEAAETALAAMTKERDELRTCIAWVDEVYPERIEAGGAGIQITWNEFNAMQAAIGVTVDKRIGGPEGKAVHNHRLRAALAAERAKVAEIRLSFENVDSQVSDEGEFTERAWEQLRAAITEAGQ